MIAIADKIQFVSAAGTGNGSMLSGILEIIWLVVICILVIGASYFVTRYIGGAQLKKQKNSRFELLDACSLGNHKHLQLFKAGSRYFLVAVSKETVTYIAELTEEEMRVRQEEIGKNSFPDILKKFHSRKNKGSMDEAKDVKTQGVHADPFDQDDIENNSKG